jgi:hypothetical protein
MSTHSLRVHDLAFLREDIRKNATRARELRIEARGEVGELRHDLKSDANDYGEETRYPHLALGYLRGRTINQMESETTRPDNLPSASNILACASHSFMRGPDAGDWQREKRIAIPVKDDRGLLAKLVGTPAPEPIIQVEKLPAPGWEDFKAKVEADIKAWHIRCKTAHATKLALRRKAMAQKEVA